MGVEGLVLVGFIRVVDGRYKELEVPFNFLSVRIKVGEVEGDSYESS